MERLTVPDERIDENYRGSKIDRYADQEYLKLLKAALDQLTEYKQAEKEGRLVILPLPKVPEVE